MAGRSSGIVPILYDEDNFVASLCLYLGRFLRLSGKKGSIRHSKSGYSFLFLEIIQFMQLFFKDIE